MEKLNTFDLNEEFERLINIEETIRSKDIYKIAKMFFNQGYENGYLDGLKDGRGL